MAKYVRCECGFEIRTETIEEFVAAVQAHGREVHNMEVGDEQALALASDVP